MEELLPSEIARLVLGYLKEEKCMQSYNHFLETCENLKECYEFSKRGRHFSTNFMGKTLINILNEYCKLCCLVQEQFKKCAVNDGVAETDFTNNPVEQLRFLFEAIEDESPTQTMLLRVTLPGSSSRANRLQQKNKSDRNKRAAVAHVAVNEIDNGNDGSNEDEVDCYRNLDLNATPLHSLPGHDISKDESASLKSRRKALLQKILHPNRTNNESATECLEEIVDLNVVEKVFLENKLHEKLAENINKVINTPETSMNPATTSQNDNECGSGMDKELNCIIKTFEKDPLFEKFLGGILGDIQEPISEDSDEIAQNWSENSTPQRSNSLPREYFQPRRRISNDRSLSDLRKSQKRNAATLRPGVKNSKKADLDNKKPDAPSNSKIDDQNAAAVQSIIEVTQKSSNQIPAIQDENIAINNNKLSTEPATSTSNISTKIISVEGKIETVTTCVPTVTNATTSDTSTTIFPTNSNYVMMTPNVQTTQQSTIFVSQDNTIAVPSINSTNIAPSVILLQPAPNIYNVPNPVSQSQYSQLPLINSQIPNASCQPLITDAQDILQMPVIMYTDNNMIDPNLNQKRVSTLPKKKSRYRGILPNYTTAPISIKIPPQYQNCTVNVQDINVPRTSEPPSSVATQVTSTTTNTSTVIISSSTTTTSTTTTTTATNVADKQIFEADSNTQTDEERDKPKIKSQEITPIDANTTQHNHVRLSMSTPRSGRSHIRALDFSTPSKYDNPRKANTSPKSKSDNTESTPKSFSFKLEPIPTSASLFRADETIETTKSSVPIPTRTPITKPSVPIATRTPTTKPVAEWDGVNLILQEKESLRKKSEKKRSRSLSESDASPEPSSETKRTKKLLGDWDADLRSLISEADINMKCVTHSRKRLRKVETNKKTKKLTPKKVGKRKLECSSSSSATKKRTKKNLLIGMENKRITRSVSKRAETKIQLEEPSRTVRKERKKKSNDEKSKPATESKSPENDENETTSENYEIWIKKGIAAKYHKKCNAANLLVDDTTSQFTITTVNNTVVVQTQTNDHHDASNAQNKTQDPLMSSVLSKKDSDTNLNLINAGSQKDDMLMSSVTRNLLPFLETPSKDDFTGIPITPRFMTPSSIETPLTKMIREQTEIISEIPTPSISFTPLFAITPKAPDFDTPLSSYQSRPTDYSSCSSYYAPSDDQNRELEQTLIKECIRYENKKEQKSTEQQSQNPVQQSDVDSHMPEQSNAISNSEEIQDTTRIKDHNQSIISNNDDENSSSSSSSDSSSNSSYTSSSSSNCSTPSRVSQTIKRLPAKSDEDLKSTATPIKSTSTPAKPASTPAKSTSTPAKQATIPAKQTATPAKQATTPPKQTATPTKQTATPTKQTATPTKQTATPTKQTATPTKQTVTPTKPTPTLSKQTATPAKSLANASFGITSTHNDKEAKTSDKNSLEQKRLRMLVKIKEDALKVKRPRGRPSKFPKSNPKPVNTVPKKRGRKPKTTLASLLNSRRIRSRERDKKINNDFEKNEEIDFPSLHISSDDENVEDTFEMAINIEKKSPITESDTEKRDTIEFLKERGILLVPNKKNKDSQVKEKTKMDQNEQKQPKVHCDKEINKDVSDKCTTDKNVVESTQESNKESSEENNSSEISKIQEDGNVKTLNVQESKDNVLEKQKPSLNDNDSKDPATAFNNFTFTNEISCQFDEKDLKASKPQNSEKVNSIPDNFSNFELEFVVEDEIKIIRVSPYIELFDLSPKEQKQPRKRIVRKVSLKTDKADTTKLSSNIQEQITKSNKSKNVETIEQEGPRETKQKVEKPRPLDVLYNEVTDVSNDTILSGSLSPQKENIKSVSSSFQNIKNDSDKIIDDNEQSQQTQLSKSERFNEKESEQLNTSLEEGECPDSNDDDDNLHNYTVCSLSPKKMKFTRCKEEKRPAPRERSKSTDTNVNKNIKQNNPQQLLLNLDVESFLAKVHGPDN